MARKIQPQSSRSQASVRSFVGLLANAIFWLIMAIVLPIKAIADVFPALVPFAPWAPIIFYGLALVSFVRSARILQGLANSRTRSSFQQKTAAPTPSTRPANTKPAVSNVGLPVADRKPTVQRMR